MPDQSWIAAKAVEFTAKLGTKDPKACARTQVLIEAAIRYTVKRCARACQYTAVEYEDPKQQEVAGRCANKLREMLVRDAGPVKVRKGAVDI